MEPFNPQGKDYSGDPPAALQRCGYLKRNLRQPFRQVHRAQVQAAQIMGSAAWAAPDLQHFSRAVPCPRTNANAIIAGPNAALGGVSRVLESVRYHGAQSHAVRGAAAVSYVTQITAGGCDGQAARKQ